MIRFARRYMVPYAPWYLAGAASLFATNWISVTIPLYLAQGIDGLAAETPDLAMVRSSAMAVALMGTVVIAVRTLSRVLFFTPGRLVEAKVKSDLFGAILRQQPAFLRQWATGDLYSRISSDVSMLRLISGFGVLQLINVILALFLAGGQMVRISPMLALYLLAPVAIALVIVQLFIQRLFILLKRMQVELAALSDHVLATYRGVATVHGFAAEEAFVARFDELNEAYRTTLIQRSEIRALLAPTLQLAVSIDVFILLFVGGPMAIRGDITVGEVVALTALVAWVSIPLRGSAFLVSVVKQAQAALERVDVLMYTPPDRPELPNPATPPTEAPTIRIDHLSFTWPGEEAPALHDLSLELKAGQSLGILGLTGSGKSTLLALLSRLRNPPRGTIFVDDIDILDLDLDLWRDTVTLVPQRAFLFSESVSDNVLFGKDDPERLDRLLEMTALAPDIAALPEGVHTEVGESGVRLSGGQRQRTALARGLGRDHRMLLLDDVLSAVDHETEAQLIETLRQADEALTTVLVAHRVSALMHCDQVLVLDGGEVVGLGAPGDLMHQPGLFRDTWEQQRAEEST